MERDEAEFIEKDVNSYTANGRVCVLLEPVSVLTDVRQPTVCVCC